MIAEGDVRVGLLCVVFAGAWTKGLRGQVKSRALQLCESERVVWKNKDKECYKQLVEGGGGL